ncbi:MAG TPA: hypothetical protein VG900_06440 [Hyphomicrobiaceae bacterium]|jgi:hypothetical protein|nr:hypothetical protein [Hyphomicrobiaceae bacterium]
MTRMMRGSVLLALGGLLAATPVQAAQPGGCETAALYYYCRAVTVALGQAAKATDPDLSAALLRRAAGYGEDARGIGFERLVEKYNRVGVQHAAKAADPATMQRLLGTCVTPDPNLVATFKLSARRDCPVVLP